MSGRSRPFYPIRFILVVVILATAACGISGIGSGNNPDAEDTVREDEATPEEPVATEEAPTETPTEVPTDTPVPTATPTTEEPTPEETSNGINLDNVKDLQIMRSVPASETLLTAGSASYVDHNVATFGYDKVVRIWDADTGEQVTTLRGHGDWGIGLEFSPDGTTLVSGGGSGNILIWDLADNRERGTARSPSTRVYDVGWSRDSQMFAVSGESSSRVIVFDRDGGQLQELRAGNGWVWSVGFSDDYLAAASDDGTVYIFDTENFNQVEELSYAQITPARGVEFSPDGSRLVGCYRDGGMQIWDTSNWSILHQIDAHPGSKCLDGDFSPDGTIYYSGGDDGMVIAWNVETGRALKTIELNEVVWAVSVTGDGQWVAASLNNGLLVILGLPN